MDPAEADKDLELAPAGADEVTADPLADGALDTLASVLRSTGRYSFELGEEQGEAELFAHQCEAWARHVLTGSEIPGVAEQPEGRARSDSRSDRAWADLSLFYRGRRRAEQTFVNTRLSEFKGIIWDLVDGLRAFGRSGTEAATEIEESLFALERAVEGDSLAAVRTTLGEVVGRIRAVMERQRDQFDQQIQRMSSRLDTMRDDLLATRRQMELDPLTRVYNRGAFDTALKRYVDLASLSGQALVLMMVDLDHFKHLNDTYGHPAGDLVIKRAADCIVRCFLRKNDFVARYGGEEFAVILFDTEREFAPRLAQTLLEKIRGLAIDYEGQTLRVTTSIGYASLQVPESAEGLLHRADAALYAAKAAGRDRAQPG